MIWRQRLETDAPKPSKTCYHCEDTAIVEVHNLLRDEYMALCRVHVDEWIGAMYSKIQLTKWWLGVGDTVKSTLVTTEEEVQRMRDDILRKSNGN